MSDDASSIEKAFQVFLPQFILENSDAEVDGYNEEPLFSDSVSEHNFVEGGRDLNTLFLIT